MDNLKGIKVAILATDGFEQVELTEPRKALDSAGAQTFIVSPKSPNIRGWNHTEWGDEVRVDVPLERARPGDFDALHLPGGVMNPDHLRMQPKAVEFVNGIFRCGQACFGDLSWALDHSGSRSSTRAEDDVLAILKDRPAERRSGLGGRRSGGRWEPGVES